MTIGTKILVPRVADPGSEETRLRRHTEIVAGMLNSLVLDGVLNLTAADKWKLALAPSGDKFVLTAPDTNLPNAKVLPYLDQYNPLKAPASPSATNDEFDAGTLSGSWTTEGPPTTVDLATFQGYAFMSDASGNTVGMYEAFTPGANAFTVATYMHYEIGSGFSFAGITLSDSSNNPLCTATLQNDNVSAVRARTGFDGTTNSPLIGFPSCGEVFILIWRDNGSNYTVYMGIGGLLYLNVASFAKVGTVARIHLQINGQAATLAGAAFDFVRVFTTQTATIGAIP